MLKKLRNANLIKRKKNHEKYLTKAKSYKNKYLFDNSSKGYLILAPVLRSRCLKYTLLCDLSQNSCRINVNPLSK